MSCARIRNKPIKFLDPQEKLIIDLKDEVRRLRQENKKLRSTMLTAPSSSESLTGSLSGDEVSPGRGRGRGNASGAGSVSSYGRASSAQSGRASPSLLTN